MLKYFRAEEDKKAALPKSFIQGFIEVSRIYSLLNSRRLANAVENRVGTRKLRIAAVTMYMSYP